MTDSETNLRTVRLRVGKEASLRREESEEAKKREAAKEEKTTMELELEERVDELERDNRALAFELKEALRDADVLRANQNEQKPTLEGTNNREEMFLEARLANLEDRMEVRGQFQQKFFWERTSVGEIGVTPVMGAISAKPPHSPLLQFNTAVEFQIRDINWEDIHQCNI